MGRLGRATVQERIVSLIHDRGLRPGDGLPPEPQLMDALDASRNSVREALRALQALGIVEIRHGHGTLVGHGSLAVMAPSLTYQLRSRSTDGLQAVQDLVQVREILECGLVGIVAHAGVDDQHLSALDGLVSQMVDDPAADRAFHALLYRGTGNELVQQLIGLFWDCYHDVEGLLGAPEDDVTARAGRHAAIVTALRTGNAEAAEESMRRHFAEVRHRIDRAELRAS